MREVRKVAALKGAKKINFVIDDAPFVGKEWNPSTPQCYEAWRARAWHCVTKSILTLRSYQKWGLSDWIPCQKPKPLLRERELPTTLSREVQRRFLSVLEPTACSLGCPGTYASSIQAASEFDSMVNEVGIEAPIEDWPVWCRTQIA